jgi:ribonuclease HI
MRPQSSICSAAQQEIITALQNITQTSKPTAISTDSLSTLLAASGNRWIRNPKTRIIRKLIDNLENRISLIWVPSHAGISGNEAADQAAKDALTEEIDNRETYPPQDLIKGMKKEEAMNKQQRWERGDNE